MKIASRIITLISAVAVMAGFAAPANACQLICATTSTTYNGNLGGIAGANAKCNTEYPGFKFAHSASLVSNMPGLIPPGGATSAFAASRGAISYAWVASNREGDTCATWTDSGGVSAGATIQVNTGITTNAAGCSSLYPLVCCNM